ncbi:MAG TPA: hypothetical protein VJZ93_02760 [Candidatus Nanoarchaeia archaeon]|nr:hypothetical protein [Candidatus Nanoarchaeia archaeon]
MNLENSASSSPGEKDVEKECCGGLIMRDEGDLDYDGRCCKVSEKKIYCNRKKYTGNYRGL